MTPPGRLSLRLALLVGALGALLALALGAMAHWNLGRELEARERENLQLKLEQIRHSLEDDLDLRSDPAVQAHALQDQLVAHSGLHLSILDSRSGQPLMSFGDQAAASVAANRALLARLQADARQPVFQSWSTGNDQRLLSIGASMRMKNGTPVQVLLSSERNADERLLDGFLRATLLALPFLLPLIALAAWWVVRAGLEPLNRFRRVAAQVSPQDLSYRIPEQNLPRELDSLARSFNHMLGRLEDGVRQLSQFSDDLAHELRAPICNLLVRNQVLLSQHRDGAAYREALESNAEELERLSRIVTDMLFLVQVDNPAIQAQFGCVALHEQAAKVIDLYEMVAEDKGVELRLSGNGFAHGDNLMIQRAISNLVSNAVRHTPQGGRIDVRIGERAGHTEVRVSNDGPGIPPGTCRTCSSASTAAPDARLEPRPAPAWDWPSCNRSWPTTAAAPKRKAYRSRRPTCACCSLRRALPDAGFSNRRGAATAGTRRRNRRGTAPGRAPAGSRASAAGRAGAAVHRAAGRSIAAAPRTSQRRRQAWPGGTTSRASSLGARAFPETSPTRIHLHIRRHTLAETRTAVCRASAIAGKGIRQEQAARRTQGEGGRPSSTRPSRSSVRSISALSQPPPIAAINWTLAVRRLPSRVSTVRSLLSAVAWLVTTSV